MTGVLIRREDIQRNREGRVETERDPSDPPAPRDKRQGPLETPNSQGEARKEFSPEPSEERWPC